MRSNYLLKSVLLALVLLCAGLCQSALAETTYEELCEQGRRHLLAFDYLAAEQAYVKAIRNNPSRSMAYFGRALALCEQGKYSKAVDVAKKAIANGAKEAPTLVILGTAHHMVWETSTRPKITLIRPSCV